MTGSWLGRAATRREDDALLRGKGHFVDDIHYPGTVEAAFVRSPLAHALIKSINLDRARVLPGVRGVFTHRDLPRAFQGPIELPPANPAIEQVFAPLALASEEVCFVGETVAIVVADNRYIAEDAAALVEVDYDPLPAIVDALDALAPDAPMAHTGASSNVFGRMTLQTGQLEQAFTGAYRTFKERIHIHRGGAFPMECRGVVAFWDLPLEALTLHVNTQLPHRLQRAFLEALQCSDRQIRIVTPDIGGGFGPKAPPYPEYFAVAAAARLLDRPVKWIEDRRENFVATYQERDQYWNVEIAVEDDGRIRGIRGSLVHESGAYIPAGVHTPWLSAMTLPSAYVLPNYRMDVVLAMTNKISQVPVRGSGRPQGVFVMERLLDRVARELNLDRAEVRRRNMVQPEQMPYDVGIKFRDGTPVRYDSGDYPRCQAKALELADYAGFESRRTAAREQGRYLGIGLANGVESTGLGPYEAAMIRIAPNGRILLGVGGSSQGQGHATALAQVAADQLGVNIGDIDYVSGDTGLVSIGHGTFGARMAVTAGSSVHLAAGKIASKIRGLAASMLEVPESEIVLRGGRAEVATREGPNNTAGLSLSFREIARKAIGMPGVAMSPGATPGLEETAHHMVGQNTYANGCHVVEAEVDIKTGQIWLRRYVVVHDCGKLINPLIVEGQMLGGVAHAIGNALLERMVYDSEAQPVSTTFAEYMLPLAPDVPPIELGHVETPSPLNPLGVKGAGEGGTIVGIAAIVSAVNDALAPLGVWINEAPISPQRICELLDDARGRAPDEETGHQ
ncbi:carbon-monoxide dehydrogenase large subunit [Bradyrhizobium sp. USDA 4449]